MTDGPEFKRYHFYQGPRALGDLWTLARGTATLRCALATHRLGWELRLTSGANRIRSEVCKAQAEVSRTSEAWETEAKGQGWS